METVTVACKLPNGLKMRLFSMAEVSEPVMGGGARTVKQYQDTGAEFTLNGFSHPQNKAPNCQITQGFALTPNVPKDFWEKWLAQHKNTAFVTQGLIFAHEKADSVAAQCKEKKDVKSGLERLDPDKMPKGVTRMQKEEN